MTAKNCPVLASAGIVGKKWVYPIMDGVYYKPGIRFNQLLDTMNGVSPKVLSHQLKTMEKSNILRNHSSRTTGSETSKYYLTPQGKDLHTALRTLKEWGVRWNYVPATCPTTSCAACTREFTKN